MLEQTDTVKKKKMSITATAVLTIICIIAVIAGIVVLLRSMGKEKMTRKRLAELTGIRPNTIGDLYREDVKKIDIQTLNKLCKVFNCEIGELLEYVPDNDEIEV